MYVLKEKTLAEPNTIRFILRVPFEPLICIRVLTASIKYIKYKSNIQLTISVTLTVFFKFEL